MHHNLADVRPDSVDGSRERRRQWERMGMGRGSERKKEGMEVDSRIVSLHCEILYPVLVDRCSREGSGTLGIVL